MIKLRIGKEEVVYSDDDLSIMTRDQLKQLKQDLQCNMEEVSAKRARYQAENNEAYKRMIKVISFEVKSKCFNKGI